MFEDAWIITSGTTDDLGEEVGEAFDNYQYRIDRQGFDILIVEMTPCNSIQGKGFLEKPPKHTEHQSEH